MERQIQHYQNKLAYEMDSSDLFDAINNSEKVVPLDARKNFAFELERIPNAINIPHREMSEESTKHLSKEVLYVCYCDGIGCNASTKGALNMTKLGFKVKELMGGIDWWKRDLYSTDNSLSNTEEPQITCGCDG